MKKHMSQITALAIGAAAATSIAAVQDKEPSWELVYANDAEGNALEGSKQELIETVRSGRPIRVYWSGGRVEHVVVLSCPRRRE